MDLSEINYNLILVSFGSVISLLPPLHHPVCFSLVRLDVRTSFVCIKPIGNTDSDITSHTIAMIKFCHFLISNVLSSLEIKSRKEPGLNRYDE